MTKICIMIAATYLFYDFFLSKNYRNGSFPCDTLWFEKVYQIFLLSWIENFIKFDPFNFYIEIVVLEVNLVGEIYFYTITGQLWSGRWIILKTLRIWPKYTLWSWFPLSDKVHYQSKSNNRSYQKIRSNDCGQVKSHRLPKSAWSLMMRSSSSSAKLPLLTSGLK